MKLVGDELKKPKMKVVHSNGSLHAFGLSYWTIVILLCLPCIGQSLDAPSACGKIKMMYNGYLNSTGIVDQIERGSANIRNSIGNYYECTHPSPDIVSEVEGVRFTMCIGDLLNPTTEFAVKSHGVCMPEVGAKFFVECILSDEYNTTFKSIPALNLLRDLKSQANTEIHFQWHCGDNSQTEFDMGAWVMISLSTVLLSLTIISQIMQVYTPTFDKDVSTSFRKGVGEREKLINVSPTGRAPSRLKRVLRKLLKAFCPSDAYIALVQRSDNRMLSGLDGLRAFSMMWIVLSHTTLLVNLLGTDDQDALVDNLNSLPQQFTLGASLAVDLFFFLSGLLTTFTLLKKMRKSSKTSFPVGKFILLRFLRLTPLYAFILFFYTYLIPYIASGPVWYRMLDDISLCRTHWWSNLLYINEFYPETFNGTCMSWSWYLANDMFFFILGLIILYIYLHSRVIGIFLMVATTLTGIGLGWWLLLKHRDDIQDDYFDKPYTRVTPFGIGMLNGILFVDYHFSSIRLSWRMSTCLMIFSLILIMGVVYLDFLNFMHPGVEEVLSSESLVLAGSFTPMENAAYQSGGRFVFSIGVSILTFLCVTGNGTIVNKILSAGFWEPLGKLTYGVYLVHPIVIRAYYYQKVQLFHFDVFEQLMYFVSNTILSYLIAGLLFVLVESPFANLAKYVYPAKR